MQYFIYIILYGSIGNKIFCGFDLDDTSANNLLIISCYFFIIDISIIP